MEAFPNQVVPHSDLANMGEHCGLLKGELAGRTGQTQGSIRKTEILAGRTKGLLDSAEGHREEHMGTLQDPRYLCVDGDSIIPWNTACCMCWPHASRAKTRDPQLNGIARSTDLKALERSRALTQQGL